MSTRIGNWFLTYTGKMFYPLDPQPEDICIEDIAHALSNLCRFGGHSTRFYSVAQHSLHVSKLCADEHKLIGLMHDASEAYVGDMVRPLKYELPQYRDIEQKVWLCIAGQLDLPWAIPDAVKQCDDVALVTERRDLIQLHPGVWELVSKKANPDPEPIKPWAPAYAEMMFRAEYEKLKATHP